MAGEKRKRPPTPPKNSEAKKVKSASSKEKKSTNSDKKTCPKKSTYVEQKIVCKPMKLPIFKAVVKEHTEEDIRDSLNLTGTNFVNTFLELQRGLCKSSTLQKIAEEAYVQKLKKYHICSGVETPELRVTAMQWHPSNPHLFVTGGKSGILQLFEVTQNKVVNELKSFMGIGPGGTMDAIRFNAKRNGVEVCTASIDGTVSTYNFDTHTRKILVDSKTPDRVWFCAVDIHQDGKTVYAGDNQGRLAIHHLDSGKSTYDNSSPRLHISKIKHLEFSSRDPNLMVTASLYKYVRLWDIRKLTHNLQSLEHNDAISSATFSLTDGCRLLTTDLKQQLRVYRSPFWTLEHKIQHPHRTFQHITCIKASWHPRADVFVIGRYPDPKLPDYDPAMRSVDVYSAATGRLRHELMDSSRLLTNLVHFNSIGSLLATTSGRTVYIWK